jgi:hypothetical protein
VCVCVSVEEIEQEERGGWLLTCDSQTGGRDKRQRKLSWVGGEKKTAKKVILIFNCIHAIESKAKALETRDRKSFLFTIRLIWLAEFFFSLFLSYQLTF